MLRHAKFCAANPHQDAKKPPLYTDGAPPPPDDLAVDADAVSHQRVDPAPRQVFQRVVPVSRRRFRDALVEQRIGELLAR